MKRVKRERELDAWAIGAWGWKKGLRPLRKPVSLRKTPTATPRFDVEDWEKILHDHNHELFNIPQEFQANRRQHLQEVIDQWSSHLDAGAEGEPITADDIWWAMPVLKKGKAGGENGLVLEMLLPQALMIKKP